jgi:Arc/MetJ-type ribon-helix-helix transcriptional regulator
MKRPTITFSEEQYEKIEKRMQEKSLKSVSECVRELVDLGLRIEEAAAKSTEKEEEIDVLSEILELKNLLKSNLVWSLEARLLTRLLVEIQPNDNRENKINKIEILEQYKNKAQNHVNELIGEA